MPTRRRGSVVLDRIEIATRFPYGLFRAWAVLHPAMPCLVYPRPAADAPLPPQAPALRAVAARAAAKTISRDSRTTTPAIRRVTSRGRRLRATDELLVKEFSGDAEATPGLRPR